MRTQTRFTPNENLIIVEAQLLGPAGIKKARLALDTGSTQTILSPNLIDEVGYSVRDGITRAGTYSVIGREEGYLLSLQKFSVLGFSLEQYVVMVLDLPDGDGIEGLLGLTFVEHFILELRTREGVIWAEPVA